MTDHCYIAVKGSLHSTDSSVFGLTTEEIIALSKRFSDSCKEVINGVLIKGSPVQVINALGEIGYRVICSSGEAEIVWTLRREVLVSNKHPFNDGHCFGSITAKILPLGYLDNDTLHTRNQINENGANRRTPQHSPGRKITEQNGIQSHQLSVPKNIEKKKTELKLGSKPEDIAEYGNKDGSVIDIRNPESLDEIPNDKKIIINTNLCSENNPLNFRTLESEKQNFTTVYSGAYGKPISPPPTERNNFGVECHRICSRSNNARRSKTPRVNSSIGGKAETVLAEYTNESAMIKLDSVTGNQPQNISKNCMDSPRNLSRNVAGSPQNMGTNKNDFPKNFRNHNALASRNADALQATPKNQTLPPFIGQKNQLNIHKKTERIGSKPEDHLQYGRRDQKIEVLNMDISQDMDPEEIIDRRIILNTNLSSEDNPMSGRNLEPHRPN